MKLYPAIDLRAGQCVRLYQGDYEQETVYGADPVAQAKAFIEEGAEVLHIVDLDAALTGDPTNRAVIGAICDQVDVPVQVGGGVRSRENAFALFEAGASRVVIGTAALENPDLVRSLAADGHGVAVGLDARSGVVATHGWTKATGRTVSEVASEFADVGVEAVIVTDIGRDGTMEGPDVDGLTSLLAETAIDLVASGGVGTLAHLHALDDVVAEVSGGAARRLAGVIVGRALYEGEFGLASGLAALAGPAT